MGRSFPAETDRQRRHRDATGKAMKRNAASRQCPKCKRKGSLRRQYSDAGGVLVLTVSCRWCDYHREVQPLCVCREEPN